MSIARWLRGRVAPHEKLRGKDHHRQQKKHQQEIALRAGLGLWIPVFRHATSRDWWPNSQPRSEFDAVRPRLPSALAVELDRSRRTPRDDSAAVATTPGLSHAT